jgi:hypothetical protein
VEALEENQMLKTKVAELEKKNKGIAQLLTKAKKSIDKKIERQSLLEK